jgi:NDP-sugar pyrophosphorylase family protein
MNGDILTTLDYTAMIEYHRASGAALTIAMHAKPVHIDLGVIENADGWVTGYIEKPTLHYDVSMGIYCYEERALEYLPSGPFQFPDLVLRLLAAGEQVAAYRTDAAWYDIGTLTEYERAQSDLEALADLRT